ncbi:DUF7689 domain-containing protein [Clostridium faecium]
MSTYNSIGEWTRALEPINPNYNCLAYAVDAGTVKGHYNTYWWEWPWGEKAHYGQVNAYMFDKGYRISNTVVRADVMSYDKNSLNIEHFAKSHAEGSVAKWGSLEVMLSPNWDPYVGKSDGYGRLQERYIK